MDLGFGWGEGDLNGVPGCTRIYMNVVLEDQFKFQMSMSKLSMWA